MRFKIFYKFLTLILIFTLMPLLWVGIKLISKSQFSLKTQILEIHKRNVDGVKKLAIAEIGRFDALASLMEAFFMSTGDWDARQKFMSSITGSNPAVMSVSLVNISGQEVVKVSNNKKLSALSDIPSDLLKMIREKNRYFSIRPDKILLIYNKKNYYIKFDIDKNIFIGEIDLTPVGNNSAIMLIDSNNEVVFSRSNYKNELIEKIINSLEISNYLTNKVESSFESISEDKGYVGSISYIKEIGLLVLSVQDVSDAYRYAMSIRTEALRIIAIFAVIVFIISYFLSKGLSGPIIKFIEAAKKVAERDFTVRVEANTRDELEDFANTFNIMVEELDRYSRLQIEKILRERKNTEAVMYSTEDGIIMVDIYFNIQLINRKALFIINSGDNNLENKNVFEVIKDEIIKMAVENAVKNEKRQSEFESETKNYKRFYKVVITDIKMKEGEDVIGYLITFYDITLDKELERMKEDFLHSITHDLRNPVSAIKGFSEFLLKEIAGPINQNQKNMIVSIDRAAFRLLQMVNNILDIAKMEAGKMEINLSRFNIVELVRKSVELMSPLAQKKNISFEINGPQSLEITADQNLMERVYINLIGNAIKFTPSDGKITIGFKAEDEMFISWVEDTGEGIPLEYIDKIFSKFEQVKGQKAGGTGLGLAISKHIIEAHSGKIWAEYRANMGAKFVFKFPLNLSKDEFQRVVKAV
ncbi:MAG: HAMP domain-containing protein [Elusimicrobiota bacterium]